MTTNRDLERLLDAWFADGPNEVADRVIDDVADRIERQPQQPAWRLRWRTPMSPTYKLGAAAAAVIIVAVLGYNLLPRQPSTGGGPIASESPTAGATVTPTSTPTATGIQEAPDTGGPLDPGRWRFHPVPGATLSVVADIPAGWLALEGALGIENAAATNSPPSGIAILFQMPAHGIFSDPCHWDFDGTGTSEQDGDVNVGPAVADLTGALRANTSFTSSTPAPVAFGSYSGQTLELRFPADLDPATCDVEAGQTEGVYRVFPDGIHSQGKANIWRMSIVDVGGTRIVAMIEYFPGTAPETLAEAEAIVESFEFTP